MIALAQGERAHTRPRTARSHTAHLPRRAPSRDPRSTQRTRGSLAAPLLFFWFAVSGPPGFAFLGARGGVRTRRRVVLKAVRAHKTALNPTGLKIALSGVLGWYTTAMARPARRQQRRGDAVFLNEV